MDLFALDLTLEGSIDHFMPFDRRLALEFSRNDQDLEMSPLRAVAGVKMALVNDLEVQGFESFLESFS